MNMADSIYRERVWQKTYTPGIPHEIDMSGIRSVSRMFRDAVDTYGDKMAFSSFGAALSFNDLDRLSRAEGQVRGIRRMVEEGAYCVDIITQIQAVQAALGAIGARILRKHVEHCVADAMRSGDEVDMDSKVDELMVIFERYLKR